MLKRVVMVGSFPPPVHGMAAVNKSIYEKLIMAGVKPLVIDISATSLERSFISRISRFPAVVTGIRKFIFSYGKKNVTLYMSISGGWGKIYEIIFILIARLKGMKLFLHHHSFAYLDKKSILLFILLKCSGSSSVHITQSKGMSKRLKNVYNMLSKTISISNVVFLNIEENIKNTSVSSLKTIGFIGNVSVDKGILEFLNLVELYESEGLLISSLIAGPFEDDNIEKIVKEKISALRTVKYVGPKYGKDKALFFSTIDVFIFPTLYSNETEGIVNHEAMSNRVPVIAYGRGCIPEIIDSNSGLVIDPVEPFAPLALKKIKEWLKYVESYNFASSSASKKFNVSYNDNMYHLKQLLDDMIETDG